MRFLILAILLAFFTTDVKTADLDIIHYDKHFAGKLAPESTTNLKLVKKQAKAGSPKAMLSLGLKYMMGYGVPKSLKQGVKYLKKAAMTDVSSHIQEEIFITYAMTYLGQCYHKGIGVDQNISRAIYWYSQAAMKGEPFAHYNLGHFNETGLGVKVNISLAKEFYKHAAKHDIAAAKEALVRLSNTGQDQSHQPLLGADDEVQKLLDKLESANLPEVAHKKVATMLQGVLESAGVADPNRRVMRKYAETVLDLPWNKYSDTSIDIQKAEKELKDSHYGMDKVVDEILSYLAVEKRSAEPRGTVICLAGPPGVGKTSIAKAIAKATGREFVRVALGGVSREDVIRGHQLTFVNSEPGQIVLAIKRADTANPVMLLDEIDKMSQNSMHGDPYAALLEVLDPEQNDSFRDNYLDFGFDLSKVLFIATANDLRNVPQAVLDRLDIIDLKGYTSEEKRHIAEKHLIPRLFEKNNVKSHEITFSQELLKELVEKYTYGAGVRHLDKQLERIIRYVISDIEAGKYITRSVTKKDLETFLEGPILSWLEKVEDTDQVGITNGLSYSSAMGGSMLKCEALAYPGSGQLRITGSVKDVLQESAKAALSYVRFHAKELNIDPASFDKTDIHVHFPEGATPKDGPSAGITLVTSIASALSNTPVKRDVAMTGEISLRGNVMPIGGLVQKIIGAHRAGVKTVLIPKANEKDLKDLAESVRKDIKIIPVTHVRQVLKHALRQQA
ncbi:MAG: endopeptidase La [Alphaproteobacteria bacterium]